MDTRREGADSGTRTGPSVDAVDALRHRALASAARVLILQLVRRYPDGLTAAEVAEVTGRHLSTVRQHLDQLTDAGLLVRARQTDGSPGRPAWRYRAGRVPVPVGGPYRELAGALVEHVGRTADDPWAAGLAAGRAWGRKLATGAATGPADGRAGDRVLAVLDRLGFAPQVVRREDGDPSVIHLHSCPFLDLVDGHPDVLCGLHLGVVRGALGTAGRSGAGAGLEPFAAGGACVVRLGTPVEEDLG